MPWTEITRAEYQRSGRRYASDMTDAEWALIARCLPHHRRLGGPGNGFAASFTGDPLHSVDGLPVACFAQGVSRINLMMI